MSGGMERQTVTFAVEVKDGVVTRIGRSYITVPEVRFRGGGVKWMEDKRKETISGKGSKAWER
mgnify:CR=1 FL=1